MREDRPSATAVLVMRGLATIAATPELASLVPPEAARLTREILRRESQSSRTMVALLGTGPFRRLILTISDRITPGVFLHFALRKRWIEGQVRAAIGAGYTQLVVLGAGLDTLALRLAPEFPDVRFVEIDHPASQGVKRRLLAAEALPANLHLCPLDLAPETTALTDCTDLDPARATVFVAEGLLMYLPVAAVERLFRGIAAVVPEARVVFTAMTLQENDRIGFRRSSGGVDRWLALRSEPFRWGISPEDVPEFLRSLGFSLLSHAEANAFRRESLSVVGDRPIAEGEHVYVAGNEGIGSGTTIGQQSPRASEAQERDRENPGR